MHPRTGVTLVTRRRACTAAALAVLLPAFREALAQGYPAKPIRLVVPFTPGGSSDVLGRAVALELGRAWSKAVVVDNLPGAGGSIATDKVAKSPADGYTLLMGHVGTLAINPWLYPKLDLQPLRAFAPVAWVARVPNVLVVHASVPARTLAELVALARSQPGRLAYGSGGNGSAAHITMEYLMLQTACSMLHVPYRGTAPSVTDLLAVQVQVLFTGVPALLPHIKAGRIRALAVSSPRRIATLPDVPTVAESGVPGTRGFEADQWYGVVAPAGTPAAVVSALNQRINESLASAEVQARLAAEGAEATPATPAAFGTLIASEMKRWQRVIQSARITVD